MGGHWRIVSGTEVSMWHCGTAGAQGCGYQPSAALGFCFPLHGELWGKLGSLIYHQLPWERATEYQAQ